MFDRGRAECDHAFCARHGGQSITMRESDFGPMLPSCTHEKRILQQGSHKNKVLCKFGLCLHQFRGAHNFIAGSAVVYQDG